MKNNKEKKLYLVDGYRIWAISYKDAQEQYIKILNF